MKFTDPSKQKLHDDAVARAAEAGKRIVTVAGAMARGMLAHLRKSSNTPIPEEGT